MTTLGTPGEKATPIQSVSDEETFANYLETRLRHALEALNAARAELKAQPDDFARASDVMQKVHELRDLREQRDIQRARVQAARAVAGLDPLGHGDPPAPAEGAAAASAFRAAQVQQAERVMNALAARPRTCPACQAMLAPDAARCHCGCLIDPDRTVGAPSHPSDVPARTR